MRTKTFLALAALVIPLHAQMQPGLLTATGQEVNTSIASPGTVECIGGTPLVPPPNPFTLCSSQTTAVHIRDQIGQAAYQNLAGTAMDMFNGQNDVVTNCNLDGTMKGYCWGTFRWTIAGKGSWSGVWFGDFDLQTFNIRYTAAGFGQGSAIEGMQMIYDAVYSGQPVGTFIVRVMLPKPRVLLAATGLQGGTDYRAGTSFILTITAPGYANKSVSVAQNGSGPVAIGVTDAQGNWSVPGTWTVKDIGSYTQIWYVGGIAATTTLTFRVGA
jgi:hypothetical protein